MLMREKMAERDGCKGSAGGGCGLESSWGGGLPTTRLRVGLFNGDICNDIT